ncbi:MAG: hypothetical protein KatS3mg060_1166 [Dehalococcoidia bacterium]|nr:MAG: hypothetical protein KatS3mg060_1166 [Dehalococcoidia bacterium]
MRVRLYATVRIDNIDAVRVQLREAVQAAIDETAEEIADEASEGVRVDTGALQASFYVVTPTTTDYPEAAAAALARRPSARLLRPAPIPAPGVAFVGSAVEHWIYNEFGTTRMSPNPTLTRATEAARPRLRDRLRRAIGAR